MQHSFFHPGNRNHEHRQAMQGMVLCCAGAMFFRPCV
jgi:hypothetical protein